MCVKKIIKGFSGQNTVEQDAVYLKGCVCVFYFILGSLRRRPFFLTKFCLECRVGHTTDIEVLAIIIPARTVLAVTVDLFQCSKQACLKQVKLFLRRNYKRSFEICILESVSILTRGYQLSLSDYFYKLC